jgi:hypothetical protein
LGEGRSVCRILGEKPEKNSHLEDPGVDGRIIIRWIFRKGSGGLGGMDLIHLAQDKDRWRAMNLRVT